MKQVDFKPETPRLEFMKNAKQKKRPTKEASVDDESLVFCQSLERFGQLKGHDTLSPGATHVRVDRKEGGKEIVRIRYSAISSGKREKRLKPTQ